jgi:multicomponent Na+:H+ antiporter subunit G
VTIALGILLALALAAAWLGAIGLLRLRTALARLHCATFVTVAGGVATTAAVFIADGSSSRAWKALGLLFMLLVIGAATSHALGRALVTRQEAKK